MRTLSTVIIVLFVSTWGCKNVTVTPEGEKAKDGVFIHVSKGYDNPQKVLMALSLAVKMTESQDVALFFDINGVNLLTKTSENIEMDEFMTLDAALSKLIKKNVLIMSCPMCTKKAGIGVEDLREGVILAEKEKFFDFTKGRILTLDY